MCIDNKITNAFRVLYTDMKVKVSQIRAARALLNWSQKDLAERSGISDISILNYENEKRTPHAGTIEKILRAFELEGIIFTRNGVELIEDHIEILEGEGCYLRLLDDIYERLKDARDKEFLVMFAVEKVSPPELDMRYRMMTQQGITYRKIISEDDSYIKGPLDWYRTMPAKYFSNVITIVYANRVAQSNGRGNRITIHEDELFAARERQIFSYLWSMGGQPAGSTAQDRYESGQI